MNDNDIPDELWLDLDQIKPKLIPTRLRLSQHNSKFLEAIEKIGADRNTVTNIALNIIQQKLFNGNFVPNSLLTTKFQ
jgi:hypothetical protein